MRRVFRVYGNESQPGLQVVEKLATPLLWIRSRSFRLIPRRSKQELDFRNGFKIFAMIAEKLRYQISKIVNEFSPRSFFTAFRASKQMCQIFYISFFPLIALNLDFSLPRSKETFTHQKKENESKGDRLRTIFSSCLILMAVL